MARFITIGYGDREGYDRTDPAVRDAAHENDARMVADGTVMGVAGAPVQVRNHGAAGLQTEDGAFMQSSLPVAGFALIEAEDMEAAITIASRAPCAVAHGVVEVWPLDPS